MVKISHDDVVVEEKGRVCMMKPRRREASERKYEVKSEKHETFCLFDGTIYGVERKKGNFPLSS